MPCPKRCSASPSSVSFSSFSATLAPEAASLYCSGSNTFTPAHPEHTTCLWWRSVPISEREAVDSFCICLGWPEHLPSIWWKTG